MLSQTATLPNVLPGRLPPPLRFVSSTGLQLLHWVGSDVDTINPRKGVAPVLFELLLHSLYRKRHWSVSAAMF